MSSLRTPLAPAVGPPSRAVAPGRNWRLAAVVAVALAPLPWLTLHAQELHRRPHYELVPFVPVGAAVLAALALRRPEPLAPAAEGGAFWTNLIASAGLALLALGVLFISPWLAAVSVLVNILALIHSIGGWPLARRLLPAWGFLWLAIPPPRGPDEALLVWLQTVATRWSSFVLDRLGVVHVYEGNLIEVPGRPLFVEEACSGITSLFTLVLGTLFIAALTRRNWASAVMLVASSFVWVLVGNVARIVLIAYFASRGGPDLSEGVPHTMLGIAIFLGMMGLVFSTDRLLTLSAGVVGRQLVAVLGGSVDDARGDELPVATPPVPADGEAAATRVGLATRALGALRSAGGTWLGAWPFATAFVLLAAAQMSFLWRSQYDPLRNETTIARAFEALKEGDLPPSLASYRRAAFNAVTRERDQGNLWGEHSRVWSYRSPSADAQLLFSLDYSFLGWHELSECYRVSSWKVVESRAGASPSGGEALTEVELEQPTTGNKAFLVYGLADYNSRPLTPPRARGFLEALAARAGQWGQPEGGLGLDVSLPSYQYQMLLVSDSPLTEARKGEARHLFRDFQATVLSRGPKRRGGVS